MVYLPPRNVWLALCLGCLVMLITTARAEAALQVGLEGPETTITAEAGEPPANPVIVERSDNELQMKDVSTSGNGPTFMLGVSTLVLQTSPGFWRCWRDPAALERHWPRVIEGVPRTKNA